METPPNRKPGRPKTGSKTTQYSVTLAPDVRPFAEQAKEEFGLSAFLTDCLKSYYQRTTTAAAETLAESDKSP